MASERIAGRYELIERLGTGGSSSVWCARDRRSGDNVALKLLGVERGESPSAVARFEREVQLLAAIRSPHVIRLLDHGEHKGRPYLVTPLIDAEDLRTLLRRRGPLPARDAAAIGAQVADGLDVAHRQQVVHRDLKPANVLVDAGGRVTLIDFGIARSLIDPSVTAPGRVVGTGEYVSPEQALGEEIDARSDLYALGVLLFELVAGHPPFQGGGFADVAARHLREPAPSLGTAAPGTPRALVDLVALLLAKRPSDRPPTATSVRDALRAIAAGHDVDVSTLVPRTRGAGAPYRAYATTGDAPGLAPWEDPTPTDLGPIAPPLAMAARAPLPRVAGGAPSDESERDPRSARPTTRRNAGPLRWLALIGLLGAFIAGAAALRPILTDENGGAAAASTAASSTAASNAATTERTPTTNAATTVAAPSLKLLPIAAAASFDPNGDGSENEDETGNAIDGDPTTFWQTETYSNVTDLAALKGGVGLELDLGDDAAVRRVDIATPAAGWKVGVYVSSAQEAPTSLGEWKPVAAPRATTTATRIVLPKGTKARFVLLWVTSIVPTGDGDLNAATISEARVLG